MESIDEQLKIHLRSILNTASEETVNGIIHSLKHAGLESLSELQYVQEEDLMIDLKPIKKRKLVKALNKLSANENNISAIGVASGSSYIPLSQNTSITTNPMGIVSPYSPPCEASLFSSNVTKKKKKEVTSIKMELDEHENKEKDDEDENDAHEDSDDEDDKKVTFPAKVSNKLTIKGLQEKGKKRQLLMLLEVYAKYKTELSQPGIEELKVWNKIANELEAMSSTEWNGLQCCSEINELKHEFERLKNVVVASRDNAWYLDKMRKCFETTENPTSSFAEQPNAIDLHFRKRNQEFCLKLLQVCAKYKAEFASPDIKEWKVWKKIATELREKYLYNCGESLCRFEIFEMKEQYEDFKRGKIIKGKRPWFFQGVQKIFENNENLVIFPDAVPNNSTPKKLKKKKLKLLEIYAKYKKKFSASDVSEQFVWKKIADEFKKTCSVDYDELECCNKINQLRHDYERQKNGDVIKNATAMFLDTARKCFEDTESPMNAPAKHLNRIQLQRCKGRMFRLILLQVYANYKTEFASPNIEEREVWTKIATELREKYHYDCGESLCQFKIFHVRRSYEKFKNRETKSQNKPYFYEEAFKAFENTDTSDYEMDEVESKADKFMPPHLRNSENEMDGSTMSSKILDRNCTVKVSNLPNDVRVSDLLELFIPFGEIGNVYTIKSELDASKCFAYITFLNQEDAVQAMQAVDGVEFSKLTLKAEWAEPLTNR